MNELIQDLAEQAGINCVVPAEGTLEYAGKGEVEHLRKFAELIVQECCRYLDHEAERLYTLSGSEQDPVFQTNFEICAEKCYDNSQGIKEHFGVER